jgi:hypothetical protein
VALGRLCKSSLDDADLAGATEAPVRRDDAQQRPDMRELHEVARPRARYDDAPPQAEDAT